MPFQTIAGPVAVNMADRHALFAAISERWAQQDGFALATINLDHIVKLQSDMGFAKAYQAQDFVVADGNPVVWLSKVAGRDVALMPGSDLVVPVSTLARDKGVAVALVGSTDASLDAAAKQLRQLIPTLEITLCIAPPFGFDPDSDGAEEVLQKVADSCAGLCFLALGAPKQECLAARGRALTPSVGYVSVGAGLDFLAGTQRRAPKLFRLAKVEWLWRLMTNPARLAGRYAKCALILPKLYREARVARRG